MTGNKINQITGTAVSVPGDDIDTDRIIPARFLKEITFANLGQYPFFDERFNADGSERTHPFNRFDANRPNIMFVNKNFGCGSSREHAPQSLLRWGIKAIVGESFAEIFSGNCNTLGIPVLSAAEPDLKAIQQLADANAQMQWTVDLSAMTVSSEQHTVSVEMSAHHRKALLEGTWDSTDLLLENLDQVKHLATTLPYTSGYSA